jgi:hypothetical protein
MDELRDHLDKRAAAMDRPPEPTDRIYVSPRGKAMLDHTVWHIVNRACEAAGSGASAPTTCATATPAC